jgi:hypothetical protein
MEIHKAFVWGGGVRVRICSSLLAKIAEVFPAFPGSVQSNGYLVL